MPADEAAEPIERGPYRRVDRTGVVAGRGHPVSRQVPGSGISSTAPRRVSGWRSGWAKSTPPCTSTMTPSSWSRSASWATTHSPQAVR